MNILFFSTLLATLFGLISGQSSPAASGLELTVNEVSNRRSIDRKSSLGIIRFPSRYVGQMRWGLNAGDTGSKQNCVGGALVGDWTIDFDYFWKYTGTDKNAESIKS